MVILNQSAEEEQFHPRVFSKLYAGHNVQSTRTEIKEERIDP
jgi:hypothetical protein